jgi:hypothetical protein
VNFTGHTHPSDRSPHTRALAVANHQPPSERLLPRYLLAVAITAGIAWMVLLSMQQSAALDLTGQVELMLPLARIGLFTTPIIVATATVIAWLVAGALDDRIAMRSIAIGILTWLPLLEVPALVDAISMLLHPQAAWAAAHVPLGIDALIEANTPRLKLLAQMVNLSLLAFTVLIARHLMPRVAAGARVATPSAAAVAVALVVVPLLRT